MIFECMDCGGKARINIQGFLYRDSFLCLDCFIEWLNEVFHKKGKVTLIKKFVVIK